MAGHHEDNVFVIGDVDESLEQIIVPLVKAVAEQSKLANGRIDLWVNSYGGYTHLARNVIELMETAKRQGVIVRTIVPDVALSAGSMIAVAGSPGERYMSKDAEHLVHYGTIGAVSHTPTQAERSKAYHDRVFRRIVGHYKQYCEIPDLESKINDDGYFITAKDCKKWKLVDHFTDRLVIED